MLRGTIPNRVRTSNALQTLNVARLPLHICTLQQQMLQLGVTDTFKNYLRGQVVQASLMSLFKYYTTS